MVIFRRLWRAAVVVVVLAQLCDDAKGDSYMDDLDDAVQNGNAQQGLSEEELALYDHNGDGELNHDEIAHYLKDTLDKVHKRSKKNEQAARQKPPTTAKLKPWKKEIGIAAFLALLVIVALTACIHRGKYNRDDGKVVPVQDVRMARLRRLGVTEDKPNQEQGALNKEATRGENRNDPPVRQRQLQATRNDKKRPSNDDKPGGEKTEEETESSRAGLNKRQAGSSSTSPKKPVFKQVIDKPRMPLTRTAAGDEKRTTRSTESSKATHQIYSLKRTDNSNIPVKKPLHQSLDQENKFQEGKPVDCQDSGAIKKQALVKVELSYSDALKIILPQILECSLDIQEITFQQSATRALPLSPSTEPAKLQILSSELPKEKDLMPKKVEKLLLRRICLELEPMKYAMKCYDRCTHAHPNAIKNSSNGAEIWIDVTTVIKDVCTSTVLKHLVQATSSPTPAEEDLWAGFRDSGNSQALSHYFLGCLTGWSSDGITVSLEFLCRLLEKGKADPQVKETFLEMVVSAGKHVKSIKRMNEIAMECSGVFKGLETLIKQPLMVQFLTEALEKEANQSVQELGAFFQKKSIFSTFLSLTTMEARITGKSRASEPFKLLPHFPRAFQSDVDRIQSQIRDGIHSCQNVVHKVLRRMLSKNQESALAWLAAVVAMNDLRSATLVNEHYDDAVAGDGFMMNLCSVLLQLCEPFFVSKGADKITDIENSYPSSKACRLDYVNEQTLTGWHIGEEGDEKEPRRSFLLPEELRGQFKLKSEVFHITHRALHIGLTNTLQHYNRLLRNYMMLREINEGKDREKDVKALLTLFVFQWDTVIQDHQFMRLCSEFYVTTAAWIMQKLEGCTSTDKDLTEEEIRQKQREVLSSIPEFYVKDMCTWFFYVAVNNPHALKGLNVYTFVDCCATLMNNKGCMPGPLVASKIVTALLAFAEACSKKKDEESLLETASWGSGIEGDLTACVVMCPVIRQKLAAALIHTYTSVDVVEGLDVDKEEFDKFSSRSEISKLLQYLWKDADCRDSLISECGKNSFQGFLNAILDSLLYLLSDGLSRVINVGKLQKSQQDQENWKELGFQEQQEKTQFLKSEEHVSKSFMKMATSTLAFLAMITEENNVARCFSRAPLSQRAASAIIGFLDSLCGPKSLDLKVKNMEKYSFNPRELLMKLVSVLLHISQAGQEENELEFMQSMATDPDYCRRNIEQAHRILQRQGLASDDTLKALWDLLRQCEDHRRQELGESSGESAEAKEPAEVCPEMPELVSSSEGEDEEEEEDKVEGAVAAAVGAEDTEDIYINALTDARYGTTELMEVTAFQCCRCKTVSQRSATIRALMREINQLKANLPIHPNSSVFVRQDEDRMDFVRAMITGPVDTPYSRGCFVFDVYFPGTYPNVPPLVKLITTGNGTVRFNPNMYADGKVCLSLLGTWHGGDASEKWDSKKSSLYQVLLSIQGMILIPDPCFNEPGYEGIRGTNEGDALSRRYNAAIRLATVRHAMVGQLRKPPAGFEEVIQTHFRLLREAIIRQCSDWLQQCTEPEEERRMRRAVDELKAELDKL